MRRRASYWTVELKLTLKMRRAALQGNRQLKFGSEWPLDRIDDEPHLGGIVLSDAGC